MLPNFLLDFVEVASLQILQARQVYPASIFAKCKKYGVPIWKCEHPWVNQYLTEHLRSFREVLERRQHLSKLDLVILDASKPLETYSFEFDPSRLEFKPGCGEGSRVLFDSEVFASVELHFRAMLLKICSSLSGLEPLGDSGLSFMFKIHANIQSALEITGQNAKWCLEDETSSGESPRKKELRIVPIFGMSEPFPFQVYAKL